MQSKTSRVALIVAAAVIAVVAFVALRPGGDDEEPTAETGAVQTDPGDPAGDEAGGGTVGPDEAEQPRPEPEGEVPEIEIEDGAPVGGVEEIEVERGGRIEFVVRSDVEDEIHVHGYELTEPVTPSEPLRMSFPADIEGIYEVEAHDAGHVLIAELRVTPS